MIVGNIEAERLARMNASDLGEFSGSWLQQSDDSMVWLRSRRNIVLFLLLELREYSIFLRDLKVGLAICSSSAMTTTLLLRLS